MLALKYVIKAPEPVDVPRHIRRRVLGDSRARRRLIAHTRGSPLHTFSTIRRHTV